MGKRKHKIPLFAQILTGMLIGILIGFLGIWLGGEHVINDWVRPLGKLFIKALMLIAVPLVLISLIKGIAELKSTSTLSRLGGRTIVIYLLTTIFAVLVGIGSALIIRPG
ncbi:MAG: cation:dicarboxylase symporter family transporter, partial [Tidjanibacter sp.]|nr:cation:dicarboxylase symporter family transporter [Tidjanibacter sp.]